MPISLPIRNPDGHEFHNTRITYPKPSGTYSINHYNFPLTEEEFQDFVQEPKITHKPKCAYCGNTSGYRDLRGNCISCGAPL